MAMKAHLQKGKIVSNTERRMSTRVPARFKVDCSHEGNFLISYSKNISPKGMFICTDDTVTVGTHVKLVFSIEDLHEVVVSANVAWVNPQGDRGDVGMGVEFVEPPAFLRQTILKIINRVAIIEPEHNRTLSSAHAQP